MTSFTPPSTSELDCLSVLWRGTAAPGSSRAMRVSEIHRDVCERRRQHGETEPTLVTISTQIRSLLQKNLVRCVVAPSGKQDTTAREVNVRTRGMLSPAPRSPLTAYQYALAPGEVLQTTFRAIVEAYPDDERPQALADFAQALATTQVFDQITDNQKRDLLRVLAERMGLPTNAVRTSKGR